MTGYTHQLVEKNLDFNGFACECARAFGALIMLRDDPLGTPIPEEFEPSKYYAESLEKTRDDLANWQAMSMAERNTWATVTIAESIKSLRKGQQEQQANIDKMNATLVEVEAWEPPSEEHTGLKDFMLQQLRDSIRHENSDYFDKELARLTSPNIVADMVKSRGDALLSDIAYREKADHEERERVASRNRWIKQLRESLAPTPMIAK